MRTYKLIKFEINYFFYLFLDGWIECVTQIGRDPNTHDFKVDWIPYWEKKLAEFFDMEVKTVYHVQSNPRVFAL